MPHGRRVMLGKGVELQTFRNGAGNVARLDDEILSHDGRKPLAYESDPVTEAFSETDGRVVNVPVLQGAGEVQYCQRHSFHDREATRTHEHTAPIDLLLALQEGRRV